MEHGYKAEDTLENTCRRIFGAPFVYRSPIINEPSGKKTELTDVLVLIGDIIVTIQSKSINIDASKTSEIDLKRIEKRYERAKKQINRTLNAATFNECVNLTNVSGHEFSLPWNFISKTIGIVTINVNDELYTDAEFRYQLPLRCEYHRKTAVHAFVLRDLFIMISEFNTPGDFVRFLDDRELILSKTEAPYINDLDNLAILKTNYGEIEKLRAGEYDLIMIPAGSWEEYRKSFAKKIQIRDRKTQKIGFIDMLINDFASNLDYLREQYPDRENEIAENHLDILGTLGKLTRLERIKISETWIAKYETTDKEFIRYFMVPSEERGLLFVIVNEPDREIRKDRLKSMCCVLAHELRNNSRFSKIKTVYGFITEGRQLKGRSFDAISLSVEDCLDLLKDQDIPQLFRFRYEGRIDEWTV